MRCIDAFAVEAKAMVLVLPKAGLKPSVLDAL
jgi:hypothetical protein